MSTFNNNLRFFCKKMGLSQQKLADMVGMKRGKIAGYFYKTQARSEFYEKLGELFELNIGRFLTLEMTEENYDSFFELGFPNPKKAAENPIVYDKKSDLIDLLMKVKQSVDDEEITSLLDQAILLYGKVLDENSRLKDTNSHLKDKLLELSKRLGDREE